MLRIFRSNRNDVTGEWRKLHNELNDLYSSLNIVWVIKSIRMRWAGHTARMGERRGIYRVLVGKPEGKTPLGRPRHRRKILRWLFRKWGHGLDQAGLAQGQVTGACECGNEPVGSVKCGDFFD